MSFILYLPLGDVPVTLKQKWAATCMPKMRSTADDTSSAVTSSSHDTWQGIEPVNHPDVTSEEVREGRGGRESTGCIKVLHTVM